MNSGTIENTGKRNPRPRNSLLRNWRTTPISARISPLATRHRNARRPRRNSCTPARATVLGNSPVPQFSMRSMRRAMTAMIRPSSMMIAAIAADSNW